MMSSLLLWKKPTCGVFAVTLQPSVAACCRSGGAAASAISHGFSNQCFVPNRLVLHGSVAAEEEQHSPLTAAPFCEQIEPSSYNTISNKRSHKFI